MTYKKVGGMHHWRLGRLGGSFYIAKTAKKPVKNRPDANAHIEAWFDELDRTADEMAKSYSK